MPDAVELVKTIKRAAVEAVEASKPVVVLFGTVVGVNPLQINVDQKSLPDAEQIVLSRHITDHTIEMTVDHNTEAEIAHTHRIKDTYTGGGSSEPTSHLHAYKGRKLFTVHNGLVVGDLVILLRLQGGQKYVVWDRIG